MRCELLVEINGYTGNSTAGIISDISIYRTGTGYTVGDTISIGSGGATAQVDSLRTPTGLAISVLSLGFGNSISTYLIGSAGSGYRVGDYFKVGTVAFFAYGYVSSVNSSGGVTGITFVDTGGGYGLFSYICYSTNIIDSVSLLTPGSGYSLTHYTTTGGTGADLEINVDDLVYSNISFLDTYDDESVSLNFVISDINDISAKNSSYSKTITVPDTKNNRQVFNYIFDLNSDSNFDPTKKSKCWVLRDTLVVFEGYLQLTSIIYDKSNFKNEYEILIFADNDTLFKNIGESYLTDLDLSPYTHLYCTSSIVNSWNADYTLGYYYPLIDYGFPLEYPMISGQYALSGSTASGDQLQVTNFLPATYLKVVTDQIFIEAGFSYKSDFFNSYFYKQLVIPFNNKTLVPYLPNLVVNSDNLTFLAHPGTTSSSYGYYPYITDYKWGNFDANIVNYNPNNFYNTATHSYTNNYPSNLITRFIIDYDIIIDSGNTSTGSPWQGVGDTVWVIVKRSMNPSGAVVSGWGDMPDLTQLSPYSAGGFPEAYFAGQEAFMVADGSGYLASGCSFSVAGTYGGYPRWRLKGTAITDDLVLRPGEEVRFFFGRFNYTSGVSVLIAVTTLSTISAQVVTSYLIPGISYVDLGGSLPANVKQKDLLSSVIKMFNLFIEPDKDVANGFIIEPRDDYYSKYLEIKDWSDKLDNNNKIVSQIASDTQNRTNLFTYKADKDIYNNSYTVNTNKCYGEYKYEIDNDFISEEKKIELIFSPTILDLCYGSSQIYLPIIANMNNGNYSRPEGMNIRLLYKKKFNMTNDVIYFSGSTYSYYPYAGPFDNPLTPTLSLNFGQVTAFYPGFTDTTNNLFYLYWQNQMTELSDKNARIITAYFYLTAYDISQFRFSDLIWFKYDNSEGYYRINKIYDYDPVNNFTTKVELIKATNYNIPLGEYIPEAQPPITIDTTYNSLISNINLSTSNIINSSSGIIISGRNNSISENSSNIVVVGRNNSTLGAKNNLIVGLNNSLNGQNCFIFGNNNSIDSSSSNVILIGNNNNITGASNSFFINYKTYGLPSRILYQDINTTDTVTPTSSPLAIYSITINAGTLKNNGDFLDIFAAVRNFPSGGSFLNADSIMGLQVNSTASVGGTLATTTSGGDVSLIGRFKIIRTSATTITATFYGFSDDENAHIGVADSITTNNFDTLNNTFSILVDNRSSGTNGTFIKKYFEVIYNRAAFDNSNIYW